jgi:hypothetical protein
MQNRTGDRGAGGSSLVGAAATVAEVATDAAEVARRLSSGLPLTDFDRERTARILDRLSEELAEAAADVRRSRGEATRED